MCVELHLSASIFIVCKAVFSTVLETPDSKAKKKKKKNQPVTVVKRDIGFVRWQQSEQ